MPEFRVRRYVAAEGQLPMICMLCGARATTRKSKRMVYRPSWVLALMLLGVLPYLIVAFILEKRCVLQAPFCSHHEGHWRTRTLILWGVFLGACVLGVAGIAVGQDVGGALCGVSCVVLLAWLITAAVLHETSLHATEITDEGMTLTGVSVQFLNALRMAPAPPNMPLQEQAYFRRSAQPGMPGPGDQYYDPRNP